jgi:uncharacterized protein YbjT (DUF2867 family)
MSEDLYLITGATGKTGTHAVRLLREKGLAVRALVHADDERSRRLADLGAQVVVADLLDFAAVSSATDALLAQGRSPFLVQHLSNVAQDYRDGVFSGTNHLVEVISGTPATTVEQFTAVNRAVFERDH